VFTRRNNFWFIGNKIQKTCGNESRQRSGGNWLCLVRLGGEGAAAGSDGGMHAFVGVWCVWIIVYRYVYGRVYYY